MRDFLTGFCSIGLMAVRAAAGEPIEQRQMDHLQVTDVAVSDNQVTAISFPGPITGASGAFAGTGQEEGPLKFQITNPPGSPILFVRALAPGVSTALSVIYQGKVYVFNLKHTADSPVLSLILHDHEPASAPTGRKVPGPGAAHPFRPEAGLAMLDRAILYPVLKEKLPEEAAKIEARKPGTETRYSGYSIRLDDVYRFPSEDGVVFHATVANLTDRELYFDPHSLTARAGDLLFHQSIAKASGIIPAKGSTVVHFAVIGTPEGGRNDLSVKNEFTLALTLTDSPPALAADPALLFPGETEQTPSTPTANRSSK